LASNSREFVAVEDAPVVRTAEPHLNQPTAGSHVAAAGFISHRPQLAGRRTCGRGGGGYAAMQFIAVVETNEHAVRLWESPGLTTRRVCTSTKSAASDITTSGRHIHTSPAEAVNAGRLIVAKHSPEACSAPLSCPLSRQRDRSERAQDVALVALEKACWSNRLTEGSSRRPAPHCRR
jgi:hypothetical protein